MNNEEEIKIEGVILLTHPVHKEISQKECIDALPNEYKVLPRKEIEICPLKIDIKSGFKYDWEQIAIDQHKEFNEKLKPLLLEYPNYAIVYAGFAPIPMIVHLGSLLHNWTEIICLIRHHQDHKWYFSFESKDKISFQKKPLVELSNEGNDCVLQLSLSFPIQKESIDELKLDGISIEDELKSVRTGYDIISNQEDLSTFGLEVEEKLKEIVKISPEIKVLHIFASIPTDCAFIFGSKIQPNIHPLIQTYQYRNSYTPKYQPAIIVNKTRSQLDFKRVLIVVATDTEATEIFNKIKNMGNELTHEEHDKLVIWNLGKINNCELVLIKTNNMGSLGSGGATITIENAIQSLSPAYVIMPGIAFGLKPNKQKIGTILVSNDIESYESEKIKEDQAIKRSPRITAGETLKSRFQNSQFTFKGEDIQFGLIISGEKLVDNKEMVDTLLSKHPEAIGGEMEGSGLMSACHRNNIEWILIKGVCDWGHGKASPSKSEDQKLAIKNVCEYLFYTIENFKF